MDGTLRGTGGTRRIAKGRGDTGSRNRVPVLSPVRTGGSGRCRQFLLSTVRTSVLFILFGLIVPTLLTEDVNSWKLQKTVR